MRGTPGNTGRTPPPGAPQPPPGEGAVVVRPPGTDARKPGDVDPCTTGLTSARARASAVVAAALVPAPPTVAVSWFAGDRDARPERAERYDLATLADDLRAIIGTLAPKGAGSVLCPATFGGADGEPDLSARRRGDALQRSTLVQLDVDGAVDLRASAPTMRDAVRMLRAWGVAALVWPSPSAVGPAAASTRFRVMVQIAPDVPHGRTDRRVAPSSYAGRRALVRLARAAMPGARIDEVPAVNPLALAFVHPANTCKRCGAEHPADAHAPRAPGDVVQTVGRAVDLDALAALAVTAGVIAPFDASADRHTGGAAYDIDALTALVHAARLTMHRRGRVIAVECPRAAEHTHGGRGERGDTSCAIGPWREPWRCEHAHGGDGPLHTAALVRLALARVSDGAVRERLDAELHAARTTAALVRERLAARARESETINALDAVSFMREVGRRARRLHEREGRAAALVRVSPGAGKSRGVGALVDACAPPPASHERDGDVPREPRPVAVALVDQRARIGDIARALLAPDAGPRRLPLVHQPVSRVMAPDGLPECDYERASGAASAIEAAGGNARTVLCIDGRCPRAARGDCPAHDSLVPHDGDGPRPALAAELGADAPRVVVATHAAPSFPRSGGVLVVDEAHGSPWASLEVDDAEPTPLHHAQRLARWQKAEGTAEASARVCGALHEAPSVLRDVEAPARLAWAVDRVCEAPAAALRRIDDALAAELGGEGPTDLRGRLAAALNAWAHGGALVLRAERRSGHGRVMRWDDGTSGVAPGAGEALRAVRAWLAGARVDAVREEGDDAPRGSLVSWGGPATVAAAAWLAAGGIVVQMDATGDAEVARAMLGAAPLVCAARLNDRRDVAREVVADTRGAARSQFTGLRRGAPRGVRWDRIGSALDAVRARVDAWREAHPGVGLDAGGLARQPIARALAAFWALPSTGGDLARAVDAACVDLRADAGLTSADVARELGALLNDPRALARASDLRALVPRWRWTYPGAALARGSNDLRGATVLVQLGDFRPPPHAVAAVAARTDRAPEDEAARLAGDVAVQWFGRARVVREGPPVLLVHVGELPPPDWCGLDGVAVVGVGDHRRAPAAAATPTPAPSSVRPAEVDTPAARPLAALLAAGWTAAELSRRLALALHREAPSIARTLRRWRQGGEAHDAELLAAVVDLAREARAPADALRARLVFLARGRGIPRVWSGARGVVGLRTLAELAGVDVDLAAVEAFAGGGDRPEVVALLLRDPGTGGSVLGALEAAHGIAPPPPLDAGAGVAERARAAAEGAVEGSAWERPDALRLRPGVTRGRRRYAPPTIAAAAPPGPAARGSA